MKSETIPAFFKPLLWSYEFSEIDSNLHKRVIIVNALNYGDLKHWRWLVERYGQEEVRRVIAETPVSEFRPAVRRLLSLLFSVTHFHDASRGVAR